MKISKNNLFVMGTVFLLTALFNNTIWDYHYSSFWGILTIQLFIALFSITPFAISIMLKIYGARKPATHEELTYLNEIFEEVYGEVKEQYPNVSKNISYYVEDNMEVNAFALGNTVTITTGAIKTLNDSELKGVIGHEFGHIVHGDTLLSSFLLLGNGVFLTIFLIIKIFHVSIILFDVLTSESMGLSKLFGVVTNLLLTFMLFVVNSILLINERANEFKADRFSYDLGYGDGLLKTLYLFFNLEVHKMTILEKIKSSHPQTADRIRELETLLLAQQL